MGISFPSHFVGISFPCNDVEMKFRLNDVGISFPFYGVGTAKHGNRKSINFKSLSWEFSQQTLYSMLSEDQKIFVAYNFERNLHFLGHKHSLLS